MCKILGLDVSSSCTGWSIIEVNGSNGKLLHYGTISPVGNMGVIQRLYFFGNKIKEIIETYNPDEVAIEETVLVHNNAKIMRTLARFSGVAFYWAYAHQKKEIPTYEPSMWKKNLGLQGSAKKPEIQLKVCERFELLESNVIKDYEIMIKSVGENIQELKKENKEIKECEKNLKIFEKNVTTTKRAFKKKKKKEQGENEAQEILNLESELSTRKQELKDHKKDYNKRMRSLEKQYDQISTDIYSDCGVNPDIADSVGVAIKAMDELNEK